MAPVGRRFWRNCTQVGLWACAILGLPSLVAGTECIAATELEGSAVTADCGYNTKVGPDGVDVKIGMALKKLHDMDASSGTIRFTAVVRTFWYDPRLDAPGHNVAYVDKEALWSPDLVVLESVDAFQESCSTPPAVVYSRAYTESLVASNPNAVKYNVFYSQACVFVVNCQITLLDFPFDENSCAVTWSPWVDRSYNLSAAPTQSWNDVQTQQYVVDMASTNEPYCESETFPGGAVEFERLQFVITIRRFSRFYVINVILPLILVVLLSWLTFFIPLEKSDRIAYAVTLLLTAVAVQFITADKRPAEKEDGWLDKFLVTGLMLITIPILETIFLFRVQVHHEIRGDEEKGFQITRTLDRTMRVLFPIAIFIWGFWFLFGSSHVHWNGKGDTAHWSSTSMVVFLAFWIPLVLIIAMTSLYNFLKYPPRHMQNMTDGAIIDREVLSDDDRPSDEEAPFSHMLLLDS